MKWLLLALVVLVVGAVLALRVSRRRSTAASHRPHRLDDSMTTRDTGEVTRPDDPTPSGPQGADAPGTNRT